MNKPNYLEMSAVSGFDGLAGMDGSGNDPEFMNNTGYAPGQTEVIFARKRQDMLLEALEDPEITAKINAGEMDEEIMDMITRGEQ